MMTMMPVIAFGYGLRYPKFLPPSEAQSHHCIKTPTSQHHAALRSEQHISICSNHDNDASNGGNSAAHPRCNTRGRRFVRLSPHHSIIHTSSSTSASYKKHRRRLVPSPSFIASLAASCRFLHQEAAIDIGLERKCRTVESLA